ncbi:FtsK/SpoIIIE domain-containing protein [Aliarcobacter cryaerophilus]|uniref:FtsK/SpoIIIE domain-containing protein n=1 Tax=Aliarcobacter cryaerophilus TaxID=28198 RepID=UPI003DA2E48C
MKYLELIKDIDKTLHKYQENIDIIEKDYPDEQLKSADYDRRKNRRSKEYSKLKSELEELFSLLDLEIQLLRKSQPHFDKSLEFQKRVKFPENFIFGRFKATHPKLNEPFIPKVIPFPLDKALYSYSEDGIYYIYLYILRALQISPLNKIEFLFIDTKTLGKSFNFIRPILNNNFIYKQRILTYLDEIETALKEMADYLENLLQKQLSGVRDWKEYNQKNPNTLLPLKVLVVNGFPEQLSVNSLLYLSRIVKFGTIAGINSFILMNSIEESNKALKKVEEIILENAINIENIDSLLSYNFKALKLTNELEQLPSAINIKAFLENINQAYMKSSTIKGEIDSFWSDDCFWKSSSIQGIKVPIGWDSNENIIDFEIGFEYSEHHTLIGGRSGSGKSNLVNVIIQNIAYMYSPDEVELFLLDYKDGVEFNSYTQPYLAHASLIAINSNVSYGVSFLKYILEEKNRRSELFKQSKSKDFKEYREKTKNKLSRIVIIIDEFQTLFTTKDNTKVEQMFAEILRKGRSFGIHLILSTQTLSGVDVGSMSQLKSQIGNRIALSMGQEESMAFLSMNNEVAAKLKGKPEAIYNNRAGNIDGNKKVFVPFASREKMEILLEKVNLNHIEKNPKIYDGDILPKIPNKTEFKSSVLSFLLGKEEDFKENDFRINFSKEYGANLLISGKNKKEKQHILKLIDLNLKNNSLNKTIYYIDNDFSIEPIFEKSSLDIFNNEIKSNSVIIIDSIDTLISLHPQLTYGGGFSLPGEEIKLSLADKFKELLENGYKKDITIVVFVDNFKKTKQKLSEVLDMFNYRLAFSLENDVLGDFLTLEYNVNLPSIKNNKGLFSNILTSELVEFKVFKDNNG